MEVKTDPPFSYAPQLARFTVSGLVLSGVMLLALAPRLGGEKIRLYHPEAYVAAGGFLLMLAASIFGLSRLGRWAWWTPPTATRSPGMGVLLTLLGGAVFLFGLLIAAVFFVSDLIGSGHAHAAGLGYVAMAIVGAPCLLIGHGLFWLGQRLARPRKG